MFCKSGEVSQACSEDTVQLFKVNLGVFMDEEISEAGHLFQGSCERFTDDFLVSQGFKDIGITFKLIKTKDQENMLSNIQTILNRPEQSMFNDPASFDIPTKLPKGDVLVSGENPDHFLEILEVTGDDVLVKGGFRIWQSDPPGFDERKTWIDGRRMAEGPGTPGAFGIPSSPAAGDPGNRSGTRLLRLDAGAAVGRD